MTDFTYENGNEGIVIIFSDNYVEFFYEGYASRYFKLSEVKELHKAYKAAKKAGSI